MDSWKGQRVEEARPRLQVLLVEGLKPELLPNLSDLRQQVTFFVFRRGS